ncbi:MAG: hypothetical protein U0169_16380 [Polyangiaceae bacterium]
MVALPFALAAILLGAPPGIGVEDARDVDLVHDSGADPLDRRLAATRMVAARLDRGDLDAAHELVITDRDVATRVSTGVAKRLAIALRARTRMRVAVTVALAFVLASAFAIARSPRNFAADVARRWGGRSIAVALVVAGTGLAASRTFEDARALPFFVFASWVVVVTAAVQAWPFAFGDTRRARFVRGVAAAGATISGSALALYVVDPTLLGSLPR